MLIAIDIKIFYFFNGLVSRWPFFDKLIVFFAAYLQYILIIAFFVFLVCSAYSRREKIKIFLVSFISVVVARLGITELIRFFYHRPRPFLTYQVHQLIPEQGYSFPSGHSTFFFALAAALYFYNKKLGSVFFIAAFLMNISRIIAGVHYPSDILGGMLIGIAVGYIVKKRF